MARVSRSDQRGGSSSTRCGTQGTGSDEDRVHDRSIVSCLLFAALVAAAPLLSAERARADEVPPADPADQTAALESDRPDHAPPASTRKPPAPVTEEANETNETNEEPGFWSDVVEKFVPLSLTDPLATEVDDNLWSFFVGGVLGGIGGQAWLPLLFFDVDAPKGYGLDALQIWAAHTLPHVFAPLLFTVPIIGIPVLFVIFAIIGFTPVWPILTPIGVVLSIAVAFVWQTFSVVAIALNAPALLVNHFYFTPVALANAYNRRLLESRGAAPAAIAPPPAPPDDKTHDDEPAAPAPAD